MADDLFRVHTFTSDLLKNLRSPSWTRLEPQSIGGDPAEGLAAAVYDPLWMLGRQWQVGELTGEDAGTPLSVEVLGSASPLSAFAAGDWTVEQPQPWRPVTPDLPLEQLTEAEAGSSAGLRASTAAAAAFVATLRQAGLEAAADAVVVHCPLPAPGPGPGPDEAPDAFVTGVARVLAGRCADASAVAAAVAAAVTGDDLPMWLAEAVPPARRPDLEEMVRDWLAWYRSDIAPSASEDDAWVGYRLEQRFRLTDGEVVLAAPEHSGDEVTWWTFDHVDAPAPDLEPPPAESTELRHRVVATPLRFPGMPASRFFELEDAQVDLGAVGADAHDLARLLIIECALVYGGDWLVVPFDVPGGSLVRTVAVTYRTTFGETFLVHEQAEPVSPWRMYDVTGDKSRALGALLVPPVAPGRMEGPGIEDVSFLRDEMANLVWAVEHVVEGASGDPIPVAPGRGLNVDQAAPPGNDDALHYLLATDVPDSWVPYLPHTGGYATVDLVRGAFRRYGPDDPPEGTPQHPRGRLLQGDEAARIASAEVPREGRRVQRIPVVARMADGTYRTWVARRATVGRGEGRSNLAFDGAEPE